MAAYGLYTHIRANRWRSFALIGGLFFLVYLLVFAAALLFEGLTQEASLAWLLRKAFVDLAQAFPYATGGTLIWLLIAYKYHQKLIDAVTGGREVTRKEEPRLYNLLENLCISRGIPMPQLKIADNAALNAFATGLNPKQYSITVTTGLLGALDDAELEAVLGHELTHIRNGDVRMMVIAGVIAGAVGFFAELFFRMFFNSDWRFSRSSSSSSSSSSSDSDRGKGGGFIAVLIAVALIALAWLLSVLIRYALSRSREYLADAGAVELTKNPDAMIMALRKIEGRGEIEGATSAVMEMCVDNPRSGFVDLFATHPSIEDRCAALVRTAGGHDPGPLALPTPAGAEEQETAATQDEPSGQPFLPERPPVELGREDAAHSPWGPREPTGPWGGAREKG